MTLVDSEAAFTSRARDLGITDIEIAALATQSVNSYAAFAFLVPYNPAVLDDGPLIAALTTILGAAPGLVNLGRFRRMQFEAYTLFLADTRARVERSDDSVPRRMPAPERGARLTAQRARLNSIDISGCNEPSHSLIDIVHNMLEEGMIKYLPLERCTYRGQELQSFSGKSVAVADVTSDYLARQAFLRRSLAFDQSQVISFSTHEKWVNTLFENMQRPAPSGYSRTSLSQILAADLEMFTLLGEECRDGIAVTQTGARPVDVAMLRLMDSAKIQFLLLPLPGGSGSVGNKRPWEGKSEQQDRSKGKAKGKGNSDKGKGKGKEKSKASSFQFPDELKDCWKSVHGKRPCLDFNLGGCSLCNPGEVCTKGVHRCCRPKCGELHSARSCNKR
jgi:hypothetical protein